MKKEINVPLVAAIIGAAILLISAVGEYTGAVSKLALPEHLAVPDLTCRLFVESLNVKAGDSLPLTIEIKNRGAATIDNSFNYKLYESDRLIDEGSLSGLGIKKDNTKSWVKTIKFSSDGTVTSLLKLEVDTDKKISESAEGNNICTPFVGKMGGAK